jgi:hypothetical protein
MTELTDWQSFYVIVGSSAGALIGLQFVLLSLLASRPSPHMGDAGAAFGTPTVVHFSVVLFLSAMASAPWSIPTALTVLWGIVSTVGLLYTFRIVCKMRSQSVYHPVFEDWVFHAVLPFISYALIAGAVLTVHWSMAGALFVLGTAMLILLFTGVHNSWDAVTYSVFKQGATPTAQDL